MFLVVGQGSWKKVAFTLAMTIVALTLSRMVLPGSEYSPIWPVTGVTLALVSSCSTRVSLLMLPTVFVWGFVYFQPDWLVNTGLSAMSVVVPLVGGILLRDRWEKQHNHPELLYSVKKAYQFFIFLLLGISLPSALLSSLVVNSLGLYAGAQVTELFAIYWLSEFAGCVLFGPFVLLLCQPQKTGLSRPTPMFVSALVFISALGVAGYNLTGLYKQIAMFVGLPFLAFYALNERRALYVQIMFVVWTFSSLFIAAGIPVVEGEYNDILFLSGIVLLMTGCTLTLQSIWMVSERRRLLIRALKHQAQVDMRTELLNDRGVTKALKTLDNRNYKAVVVRVHQSKGIVESLGVDKLPSVLSEIAERLHAYIPNLRITGLINGSTIIAVTDKSNWDKEVIVSDLLLYVTGTSFLADKSLSMTDLDVACLSFNGKQGGKLLERLSIAAHLASQNPVQRYYEDDIDGAALWEPTAAFQRFQELKRWLDEDRLVLWGQPIKRISNRGGRDKTELLARIVSPSGQVIYPDGFLPLFHQFGFQTEFDKYVLRKGFEMLEGKVGSDTFYTINVSAHSFSEHSFPTFIESLLAEFRIDSSQCGFELTETDALPNVQSTAANVERLKKLGFEIGLDDFGTGFANYAYLLDIPFNFVKLDGRFIKDIEQNASAVDTVKAIVSVAKSCHMTTVAEFVENDVIEGIVKSLGVDYAQGYGISRPVPIDVDTPADGLDTSTTKGR